MSNNDTNTKKSLLEEINELDTSRINLKKLTTEIKNKRKEIERIETIILGLEILKGRVIHERGRA